LQAQLRRKQFEDENRRIRDELLRTTLEITEARAQRELAEARAALVGELERKNDELEAFTYSVSHDLRAPLRSIDGFSQALLEDYAGRLDEKGQGYLRRVRSAAQRMGDLIDDLLQLSRINRMNLDRERTDLSGLARLVVADLRDQEPANPIEVDIPDGLTIEADGQLMRIVLENLFGNAFKFTRQSAAPRVELGLDRTRSGPAYFIRDNGVGFDMAYADKLFGVFQRLHTQEAFPGTGIGLATVQRIIQRHGGQVWAESRPDAGATFYFTV
jgi:light-regulated signal transduction histidine kinase (bacteriophytochrome)